MATRKVRQQCLDFFLDVVVQGRSGILVESVLEDEEHARTALGFHLSMDLLFQEMLDAWLSEECRKVGNYVLK